MNYIGISDEDTLVSSIGSFDSMTYGKKLWVHFQKYFEERGGCRDGGIKMWSMKPNSRQRSGFNLT